MPDDCSGLGNYPSDPTVHSDPAVLVRKRDPSNSIVPSHPTVLVRKRNPSNPQPIKTKRLYLDQNSDTKKH